MTKGQSIILSSTWNHSIFNEYCTVINNLFVHVSVKVKYSIKCAYLMIINFPFKGEIDNKDVISEPYVLPQ